MNAYCTWLGREKSPVKSTQFSVPLLGGPQLTNTRSRQWARHDCYLSALASYRADFAQWKTFLWLADHYNCQLFKNVSRGLKIEGLIARKYATNTRHRVQQQAVTFVPASMRGGSRPVLLPPTEGKISCSFMLATTLKEYLSKGKNKVRKEKLDLNCQSCKWGLIIVLLCHWINSLQFLLYNKVKGAIKSYLQLLHFAPESIRNACRNVCLQTTRDPLSNCAQPAVFLLLNLTLLTVISTRNNSWLS